MSNSGHHDCSIQAVFLCTAVKLQSCHMLAHQLADNTRSWHISWHMLAFYIQPPPFIRAMALGGGLKELPRSISLGNPWLPKCTALVSLLWIYSNSGFNVQSVGYKSAQSPTNWELIHGKDPSILCRLSSRLSIAPDDKNPKCEIQDCGLTQETWSSWYNMSWNKSKNLLSTQLQFLRDQGPCKTAWNMRCSRLISMYVWVSGASGAVTTKWG